MPTLTDRQLHDLARLGAIARLKELDEEAAGLRKMFPGLKKASEQAPEPTTGAKPANRKRKKMSPAARKAVGERMKLYWAKKRGEAPADSAAEVAGKAEEKATATTTPVAPVKKKATKKAKKASRPKKAKRGKKTA